MTGQVIKNINTYALALGAGEGGPPTLGSSLELAMAAGKWIVVVSNGDTALRSGEIEPR